MSLQMTVVVPHELLQSAKKIVQMSDHVEIESVISSLLHERVHELREHLNKEVRRLESCARGKSR